MLGPGRGLISALGLDTDCELAIRIQKDVTDFLNGFEVEGSETRSNSVASVHSNEDEAPGTPVPRVSADRCASLELRTPRISRTIHLLQEDETPTPVLAGSVLDISGEAAHVPMEKRTESVQAEAEIHAAPSRPETDLTDAVLASGVRQYFEERVRHAFFSQPRPPFPSMPPLAGSAALLPPLPPFPVFADPSASSFERHPVAVVPPELMASWAVAMHADCTWGPEFCAARTLSSSAWSDQVHSVAPQLSYADVSNVQMVSCHASHQETCSLGACVPGIIIASEQCSASDEEDFGEKLRSMHLPIANSETEEKRVKRLSTRLQKCIQSLYRDRVLPTIKEIKHRLVQQCGWTSAEVQFAMQICARFSEVFRVQPPRFGHLPVVLLRKPPKWFEGWVDAERAGDYSDTVWEALRNFLEGHDLTFQGGIGGAADELRRHALPELEQFTLGELRHILEVALGKGMLVHVGRDLCCPHLAPVLLHRHQSPWRTHKQRRSRTWALKQARSDPWHDGNDPWRHRDQAVSDPWHDGNDPWGHREQAVSDPWHDGNDPWGHREQGDWNSTWNWTSRGRQRNSSGRNY